MHAKNNNQRGKEGLSLFGIMNQTKTRMGRSLLERWFLRPLLNVADINQRLDAVQTFATLDFHAAERLTTYLKHIKNIPIILTKLLTKLTHSEWQSLLKFSFYALKIRAEVRDSNLPNIPLLRSVCFS